MRSSAARQTSTADVRPDATASPHVRRGDQTAPSAQHPWYFEQTGLGVGVGRGGERGLARQARARTTSSRIDAPLPGACDVGSMPVGVDTLHLLGVGEDAGELPREQILLVGVELEAREARDALDVLARESSDIRGMLSPTGDGMSTGLQPAIAGWPEG